MGHIRVRSSMWYSNFNHLQRSDVLNILSLVTECCPGSKVAQSCIITSDLIYKLGMLSSR
jgi:hypothetical protein